ncbi:MAG: hypothetical protein ABIN57_05105 [Chitinophagaceae bacterium]
MKILKKGALCALLTLLCVGSFAQRPVHEKSIPLNEPNYRKPKLFEDLPETISLNVQQLQHLLDADLGKSVSFPMGDGINYQGTVISKSNALDETTKSVVVKSTNRRGATFTFSKITGTDGLVTYRGRIISFNNIDAFELAQENGHYILQKKSLYDLYNE